MNVDTKLSKTPSDGCMTCIKKERSLFCNLSYEELEELNKNRFSVHYAPGEYIYKQGVRPEHLICLNSGKVKITKLTSTGKIQIIGLNKTVDFLGVYDLINNTPYTSSGIALENASACFIPKYQLDHVIAGNSDFAKQMIGLFAEKVHQTTVRFTSHTQKHLRGRLADTLLYIYETFGFQKDSNILDVLLKRSDIAELSSMDVSNASRSLSEFVDEGIITLQGRKIEIFDMVRLTAISIGG